MFRVTFLGSLLLIITSSSFAEDTPAITSSDQLEINEGTSLETAIVIRNIRDYDSCPDQKCITKAHETNIGQEIDYIEKVAGVMFKDWAPLGNQLLHNGNKHYDEVSFSRIPSNEQKKLYFDITEPVNAYLARMQKNDIPIVEPVPAADNKTETVAAPENKPLQKAMPVRDGKSTASAIIIQNHDDVLPEQYAALERLLGPRTEAWEPAEDRFIHQDDVVYNRLTVTIYPARQEQNIYFDITARHKKLDEEFWKEE